MDAQDRLQASSLPSSEDLELLGYFIEEEGISSGHSSIARRAYASASPLSFAQERLWFLAQLEPDKPVYNVRLMTYLHGPLNLKALQLSLREVIQRHEILRTTFEIDHYNLVQVVHPSMEVQLPLIDLSTLSLSERSIHLEQLTKVEARRLFHLTKGPLLRGMLLRLAPEEHILFLTLHHIITDGWSTGIFKQELGILYESFASGTPPSLPDLPIQYADFAAWQRQQFQGEHFTSLLAYWREQLAGSPPLLEFPFDHPRPPVPSYTGASFALTISPSLTQALKALSQKEGVTLFMTLLAAFQALLARFSGQEDIVVGTPIANRTRKELEGLIGFFVNTLVLRTNLSGNPRFLELLQQVRQTALGAYIHQDMPFEKLVEELQPERTLSYHPLFQIMFQLDNTPSPSLTFAQLSLETVDFEKEMVPFDLELSISEEKQGLFAQFDYNTDLFDKTTIVRFANYFQAFLASIADNPTQHLSDISLLSITEHEQMLVSWNATQTSYPEIECIQHLFEKQAERIPDAIAVTYGEQHVTYQELNRRANQLAYYLRTQGVGSEVRVGLCMERSIEIIIGLLGILKAGGVYVPLDPTYPASRLSFMLTNANIQIILTQESLKEHFSSEEVEQILCLDSQWSVIAQVNGLLHERSYPENLAYVVYTSGSTGRPKGIAMTHRAITNLIVWGLRNTSLANQARTLQFASPSFDVSLQEMFLTWGSGGIVLLISQESRRNMEEVAEIIYNEAIERLYMPAMTFQQLAQIFERKGISPSHLCEIIAGSEQLQITEPIIRLLDSLESCILRNEYGPSESHVATAFTVQNAAEEWVRVPPIGRPIANTEIYILDRYFHPVPVGVPGEIYIGGAGLARGYLGRPDLTADRFIPNPYGKEAGTRIYKTGDLARYRSDGDIEFLGRIDHQIKLRGYRIELGEIETILTEHPGVNETVVLLQEGTSGNKQLIAYIVVATGWQITPAALRAWLRERLPDYMVPSAFTILEHFPLTAHGKIDRQALLQIDTSRPELETEFVAPRTPLEETLAGIWSRVFNLQQIGIYDNFFDLGGHSMLATMLMVQIQDHFQMQLTVRDLFEQPTIAGLAESIELTQLTMSNTLPPPNDEQGMREEIIL